MSNVVFIKICLIYIEAHMPTQLSLKAFELELFFTNFIVRLKLMDFDSFLGAHKVNRELQRALYGAY